MGLVQHLQSAVLRIYSYIYDLLGLGALVNLVFRAVVSSSTNSIDCVTRRRTPHPTDSRLDCSTTCPVQMWFVELDVFPDFFIRRCIRLLLKIRLISVSLPLTSGLPAHMHS